MTASPAQPLGPTIEARDRRDDLRLLRDADRGERDENEGVTATVNYATEKAQVQVPDGIDAETLIGEVAKAGYTAALPRKVDTTVAAEEDQPDIEEAITLRNRLIGSVVLAVPVIRHRGARLRELD